jgi:hypothetical protein
MMDNVINFKGARPRRLGKGLLPVHRPWWRLWFWPAALPREDLRRLAPEELRRGGIWGPQVDRGRQNGADLRLL